MANIYIEPINENAKIPSFATDHAACMDVCANLTGRSVVGYEGDGDGYEFQFESPCINEIIIEAGQRLLIPTGLKICCDPGYRVAMYPRSGLATNEGVTLANCVGVIDADYRGEVMVPIINHSTDRLLIRCGSRIAQIALERLEPTTVVTGVLPETNSNRDGGFGSTGV